MIDVIAIEKEIVTLPMTPAGSSQRNAICFAQGSESILAECCSDNNTVRQAAYYLLYYVVAYYIEHENFDAALGVISTAFEVSQRTINEPNAVFWIEMTRLNSIREFRTEIGQDRATCLRTMLDTMVQSAALSPRTQSVMKHFLTMADSDNAR